MRRMLVTFVAIVALFALASSPLAAAEITVSPNVINISSASTVVTVHTDLPYCLVEGASVTLNGLDISWWKSDDRGYFVAKFSSDEVKALERSVKPRKLRFCHTDAHRNLRGEEFSGTDSVKVINVTGKKK